MFRRSRQRIVAVIMAVLIVLLVGTLCVIYGTSYADVYRKNQNMLEHHIKLYLRNDVPDFAKQPIDEPDFEEDATFRLSTFYSVLLAKNGSVIDVDNISGRYSDEDLQMIAKKVSEKNSQGTVESLIYRYEVYDDYILVAFMDNAIMQESITTLFRHTMVFGSAALIAMFFLAKFAARKIVQPLEESHCRQKQFISDAGHELKTPVSVIDANAEMLERQIGDNQWLANIQYESAKMGVLVKQLLELARTEQVVPDIAEINLSRVVMGETLPFESIAYEQGITLQCNIAENVRIMGNVTQFGQLVSILLDNAIRHSKSGGLVQVYLFNERKTAQLSVSNEGSPIPEEQRKQLFERFYRIDEARNGEDQHYGLGLSIAKAIVEAHKGKIDVRCYDDLIEFYVQFPIL